MLQEDRYLRIQSLLASLARVRTEHLVQDLQVSRETIRQDLLALEALGLLRRVHGGAVQVTADEPPFVVREATRVREKRALAKAALKQVLPGQLLFIDAGTTTALLAETLPRIAGLTLVTNSITIALTLGAVPRSTDTRVILLGGEVRADVPCTQGPATLQALRHYRADAALLSPVGISAASGISYRSEHESHIAETMAAHAGKLIVLADHSKVGRTSHYIAVPPDRIDCLLTNADAHHANELQALRAASIDVVTA